MKTLLKLAAVCMIGALLTGCGNARQEITPSATQETQQEMTEPVETQQTEAQETEAQETEAVQTYEDNFAVDSAAAKAFAQKVKDVTAKKDLEGLAELTAFPVYVGLPGVGGVETKEAFLKLGADAVFTEELLQAVAAADIDNLQPSMAGFSISHGGSANINFGVRDGVLAISGINY